MPSPDDAARKRAARDNALRTLDEQIGQALRDSDAEMRASPSFGKPLADDGYFDAPPELRMAFKVLKDAGAAPAEVELMRELQRWRDELARLPDGVAAQTLRRRIAERELEIAMRVERLAKTLTL